MTRHDRSPWLRCLIVWLLGSAGTASLASWLLTGLGRPATFETALVDLMSIAGATAAGWLWLITSITTLDAARGHAHRVRVGIPLGVRRAVLAACGIALASGALALPAHAADGYGDPSVLAGLPLPDRPSTLGSLGLAFEVAHATVHPAETSSTRQNRSAGSAQWVVRAGDSLWSIAARQLPPGADDDEVARACARLYRLNRAVIGGDPDVIRPGQRLRLPDRTQEDS